ncbi:MAG: LamG domain-containing protein, partial [Bacteroidia bacterium]
MKHLLTLALVLCIGTFAHAQIPSYVPTNGLVGWWPFNGNANDESGNGNHGTVNGATLAADRFGNTGKAYSFDGVDDFIVVPHDNSLNLTSFSLSTWVFFTNQLNDFNEIITKGGDLDENYEILIYGNQYLPPALIENNPIKFTDGVRMPFPTHFLTNQTFFGDSLMFGSWQHIVNSYNLLSGEKRTYLNGILVSIRTTGSRVPASNSDPLFIGRDLFNWRHCKGEIDDIAIYNRALTAAEVQQLYSGQSACNLTVNLATS